MKFQNISEYRARAEKCFRQSAVTSDIASKLHWLTLSEVWLLLADNMGKRDVYDACGVSVRQFSVQQQDSRHLV